jgi:CBS domain-containing protein
VIEPVTVTKDAELADIMRLVVEKKIHRVWVSSDQGFPIGVVTLSDIIRVFT